ncbi:MAG: CBS domain-containing protein [Spirochaetaceae bacterium]
MATVKEVMEEKGNGTNYTIQAEETVLKALQIMADANIGAVIATEGGKVVGIFTERDYARKGELKGKSADKTLLKEVMTEKMMTVTPGTSVEQCMKLMNQYHIRHLPVLEDKKMIGIVSIRDLVDILLGEREEEIKGLESFILSTDFNT